MPNIKNIPIADPGYDLSGNKYTIVVDLDQPDPIATQLVKADNIQLPISELGDGAAIVRSIGGQLVAIGDVDAVSNGINITVDDLAGTHINNKAGDVVIAANYDPGQLIHLNGNTVQQGSFNLGATTGAKVVGDGAWNVAIGDIDALGAGGRIEVIGGTNVVLTTDTGYIHLNVGESEQPIQLNSSAIVSTFLKISNIAGEINPLSITGVSEFADNAAALTGGLNIGDVYRTGDLLKIVH